MHTISHIASSDQPTAVDLFCGCGGISCGLQLAGFRILAGSDIEDSYRQTFAHNFRDAQCLGQDLSETSPSEFMKLVGIERGQLDLLAGGPPCQGFSKNVPRSLRSAESTNNRLVTTYLDYCEAIQPKLILMENVAEMRNGFDQQYTEEIERRLTDAGYAISSFVFNAADYGIPQRRRRAFFLGNRCGLEFVVPPPTHFRRGDETDLFALPNHVTVWEAIGDLCSLEHGKGDPISTYVSAPQSDFQKMVRGSLEAVSNHQARRLQDKQYQRLASLLPGQGIKDLPDHLRPKGGYSGAYGRLTKDMIAPTITRWVFHPGSGRWGHPIDIRTLTIREAARIQGFPDWFEFIGSFTEMAGQIGNAVPPFLVKAIAESMQHQIRSAASSRRVTKASKPILLAGT
jgi:DNA (cytosine-5)-methyltransferase 1